MKKVTKNFNSVPSTLTSPNCKKKVKKLLQEKGRHKFSTTYYSSNSIKSKLSKIYNDKCAYCENDTTAGASLQVEHYRPKVRVSEDDTHPGYYWLGYEWSNLLFACSKCNRSKGNSFPIQNVGSRVFKPSFTSSKVLDGKKCKSYYEDLLAENPLIINPEIESPRGHLSYLPSGKIKGNTQQGITTIKICKLYRNPLAIARKKMIADVLFELKKVVFDYRKNETTLDTVNYVVKNEVLKLLKVYNENSSFSELALTALLNFDYFFIRRFGNHNDRELLFRFFNQINQRVNL